MFEAKIRFPTFRVGSVHIANKLSLCGAIPGKCWGNDIRYQELTEYVDRPKVLMFWT